MAGVYVVYTIWNWRDGNKSCFEVSSFLLTSLTKSSPASHFCTKASRQIQSAAQIWPHWASLMGCKHCPDFLKPAQTFITDNYYFFASRPLSKHCKSVKQSWQDNIKLFFGLCHFVFFLHFCIFVIHIREEINLLNLSQLKSRVSSPGPRLSMQVFLQKSALLTVPRSDLH